MPQKLPVLAVTMGDPAGIGPEITVKALLAPEVHEFARPFVIGDADVLEQALQVCGLSAPLHRIARPAEARFAPGEIDVLDLGIVTPDRLDIGKVQAAAGAAAFAYIRRSIEVALAGEADAVVTGPINKEALRLARVPYIGHTEIFANLTGAREEMTMFTIGELKIFFLTRHVSLLEACRLITRERVLAGIEKSMRALRQLGITEAHLAVAGLNPRGPVPADSVFHFARLGRYDAVLSLYHDQGHIAVKMVDFDRTVSVTLGLPIMRASVDHGTAFDIAGTGKASAVSLIEALRVGARYAGRGVRLEEQAAAAVGV